jgi:ferrous iron transport protein A
MPLLLSPIGKEVVIDQCHAQGNLKRHMEDLGLFPGERIVLVSENDGNLILKVHETRLAINQDLASKIYVKQVS